MADEAKADSQQDPQGQQAQTQQPQTVRYLNRDLTPEQLLEETQQKDAYITQMQQQQAAQPEEAPEEMDLTGIAPDVQAVIRQASGADELKKELKKLREEREEEKRQQFEDKVNNDISSIAKEFPPSDGYPAADNAAIRQHMQKTGIFNPKAAYKDMHEAAIYDKKVAAAQPKTTESDRSDAPEDPKMSKEDYNKKLLDLSINGTPQQVDEFMLKHGSIAPKD